MSRPEENIDKLIRDALSNEEAEAYDQLGEQTLLEEALSVLNGRAKYINWMVVFFSFVFFGIAVYAAFQFFDAIATKELIMWSVIFIISMTAVSALKMWYWMEMNKNATIRELKRVELQVSHLANVIEAR
jgi:hypothetical protein